MGLFLVGDHWNQLCSIMGLPKFQLSMKEKERAEKAKARAKRLVKRKVQTGTYRASREDALSLQKKLASTATMRSLTTGHSAEDLFALLSPEKKPSDAIDTEGEKKRTFDILSRDEEAEVNEALKAAKEYCDSVNRQATINSTEIDTRVTLSDYFSIAEDQLYSGLEKSLSPAGVSDRALQGFHNSEGLAHLQRNIGEVHLELALLEAYGRFSSASAVRFGSSAQCAGTGGQPDISSCFFHLSAACRLGSCAAALALGRVRHGMTSDVSPLLSRYVSVDEEEALGYFMMAAYRGSRLAILKAAEIWESLGRECTTFPACLACLTKYCDDLSPNFILLSLTHSQVLIMPYFCAE